MKLFVFLLALISVHGVAAQIRLSVTIDETSRSVAIRTMFCDEKFRCGLFQNESTKTTKEAGILTNVSRTRDGFHLKVDTNGDGRLNDEKKRLLKRSSSLIVKVRMPTSKSYSLFEISHERGQEMDGSLVDDFSLTPHYVGKAQLAYRDCRAAVSLSDLNFDGTFTNADANRGTNLGIDRDNDGRFWGKEEHARTSEIIEFCGQNFLVSHLSREGLTLSPTDLQIAK